MSQLRFLLLLLAATIQLEKISCSSNNIILIQSREATAKLYEDSTFTTHALCQTLVDKFNKMSSACGQGDDCEQLYKLMHSTEQKVNKCHKICSDSPRFCTRTMASTIRTIERSCQLYDMEISERQVELMTKCVYRLDIQWINFVFVLIPIKSKELWAT